MLYGLGYLAFQTNIVSNGNRFPLWKTSMELSEWIIPLRGKKKRGERENKPPPLLSTDV